MLQGFFIPYYLGVTHRERERESSPFFTLSFFLLSHSMLPITTLYFSSPLLFPVVLPISNTSSSLLIQHQSVPITFISNISFSYLGITPTVQCLCEIINIFSLFSFFFVSLLIHLLLILHFDFHNLNYFFPSFTFSFSKISVPFLALH